MSNIPSRFAAKGGGTRLHSSLVGREECRLFAEGRCRNGSTCLFLHRISIKRPIGFRDCKTNDVARPLRQNYDHTPLDFTVDLEGSSVDTPNTLRLRLQDIQARPQGNRLHVSNDHDHARNRDLPSMSPPSRASDAPAAQQNANQRLRTNPCFEWEKTGACTRGDACWYRHDVKKVDPAPEPVDEPPSSPVEDSSTYQNEAERRRRLLLKSKPCFAWGEGKCRRGDACWYNHGLEVEILRVISSVTKAEEALAHEEAEECKKRAAEEEREEEERRRIELERVRRELEEVVGRAELECPVRKAIENFSRRREGERRQQEEVEALRLQQQAPKQRIRKEIQGQIEERKRREENRKKNEEERSRREEEWKRREEERNRKKEEWKEREERRKRQEEERARKQEEWMEREEKRKRKEEAHLEREKKAEEKRQREAGVSVQRVVQQNNLVTFAAGLHIEHLIPGFDMSSILVRDLPKNTTDKEIVGLFRDQGMEEKEVKLVSTKPEGDGQTARIVMRSEVAKVLAPGLEGLEFKDKAIKVEICQYTMPGAMTSFSGDKGAMTLSVSWRLPSASMVACYNTVEEARTMVADLNGRLLRDRKISAVMNPKPTGTAARYWVEASIKIGNLAPETETNEVQVLALASSVRSIKSFAYDSESFRARVETFLEGEGCVPGTFQTTIQDHTTMKATVEFSTRTGLEKTGTSLQGGVLGAPCPKLFVAIPKAHQYSISIPPFQYKAQEAQWEAMTESARGQGAFIRVKEGNHGKTYVNLHGSDEREVGTMKVRVEGLVAGEALDDAQYWHTGFLRTDGSLFNRVFEQTGAWMSADPRARTLRAFGSNSSIALAKDLIRAEVDRLVSIERDVPIPRWSVRFFVATGLDALKEAIGEDKVSLDVSGLDPKIRVRGGDDAAQRVFEIMSRANDSRTDKLPPAHKVDDEEALCPVCYDTPALPQRLVCGHSCCTACLRHYLASASSSNKFPLVCMGNNATCNTPIPIPVMERYLTDQQFTHLLDVAFTSYIQSNGGKFKYCATPSCAMIYQCDTGQKFHRCPSCFATICSSCDKGAHEGMTCEERRLQGDPAEQERLNEEWAKANNAQRCPGLSCGVLTEKISGCNHMTCVGCNAHWCWLCRGVFPSEAIYSHLNEVHGGFGI